jgi:hypothetical protein
MQRQVVPVQWHIGESLFPSSGLCYQDHENLIHLKNLKWLSAWKDFIESCLRENFKAHIFHIPSLTQDSANGRIIVMWEEGVILLQVLT